VGTADGDRFTAGRGLQEAGVEARSMLPRTLEQVEQRLFTMSSTVATGTPLVTRTGNVT
jgi:hypothetical protein